MDKNYSSFYESLDIKLDEEKIETKFQLKQLMEKTGFLLNDPKITNIIDKNNKIVKYAWDYLKEGAIVEEKRYKTKDVLITKKFKEEQVKKVTARHTMKYKGIVYKKGTSIPDDVPFSPYKTIRGRYDTVRQAEIGIKIKGKWYRKGQFLPKSFRWD